MGYSMQVGVGRLRPGTEPAPSADVPPPDRAPEIAPLSQDGVVVARTPPDELREVAAATRAASTSGPEFERRMREMLATNEGRRSHAYLDSKGIPTVGIGFNLDRGDARGRLSAVGADYDAVRSGREGLTERQIDALFSSDLAGAERDARRLVGNYGDLSPARKAVVVDMIFNMGAEGFSDFHATIRAIETGDYATAAAQMRKSKWFGDVGDRAVRDIRLMKTGAW